MAELVDAQVLGTCIYWCGGSSPFRGTTTCFRSLSSAGLEQQTSNLQVAGSSPAGIANKGNEMHIEVLEVKDREDGGADILLDLDKEALHLLVSSAVKNALMLAVREALSSYDT